jgi:hypothetical protein
MDSSWGNRSKWTIGILSDPQTDEVPGMNTRPRFLGGNVLTACSQALFCFWRRIETSRLVSGTNPLEHQPHLSLRRTLRAGRLRAR